MDIFQQRTRKAQQLMKEQGIDALLVLNLENYYYFSGDIRRQPRLLIPKEGDPTAIVFAGEKEDAASTSWVKQVIPYRAVHEMMLGIITFFTSLGVDNPKVGIEMDFSVPAFLLDRFKMANPQVQVVDARPVTAPLRKVKDETEVARIRKASAIADAGMKVAIETIKEGVAELDVAIEVEYAMKKNGAERVSFPIFINSGRRSLWLHGMATSKKIEKGDLIIVDLGPVYQGYCADICRTFVLGKPREEQKRVHSLYLDFEKQIIGNLKPGVKVFELEEKNQELADKAGYGEYYVRGFLHGLGLAFEETPFPTIFPEDTLEPITAGMTLGVGHSVLAIPGIGGARVEDTVHVTDKGTETFTRFPRELKEVG